MARRTGRARGEGRDPDLLVVSLVIPRDLLAEVDAAAERLTLARSAVAREALRAWLRAQRRLAPKETREE